MTAQNDSGKGENRTGPSPAKKSTILILEDQRGFRRIYHDLLEKEGYGVLEGANGEEGWDIIIKQKPDLVLLDLGLPLQDGFQVLEKIRRSDQTKHIPVIIFSALGEPRDVQRALQMGANDYTVKGFYTPRQILTKIKDILHDTNLKKTITSYRLIIREAQKDAARLEQDLGLESGFQCPACNANMDVEFFPDFARSDGRWFSSRFICPDCNQAF
jgi:DNA-binding response OmpR family regulator